jgi:hypothetical protein
VVKEAENYVQMLVMAVGVSLRTILVERHVSPSNMLLEAISEALGIDLSEVLSLYFGEFDDMRRGHLIGEAMDRKRTIEEGEEWLADDNLNTTQTPECTKEKYNAKIKVKGSLLRPHQQPT